MADFRRPVRFSLTPPAYDILAPAFDRLTQGFDTADLKDANALLGELK